MGVFVLTASGGRRVCYQKLREFLVGFVQRPRKLAEQAVIHLQSVCFGSERGGSPLPTPVGVLRLYVTKGPCGVPSVVGWYEGFGYIEHVTKSITQNTATG